MTAVGETTSLGATPEEVTASLQRLWDERGAAVGRTFTVTPCPYSAEEIAALQEDGRRLAYLPPEVATRAGRHWLGKIWPLMECFSVLEDNVVSNVVNPSGWFDYESQIDAPNVNLDQAALLAEVERQGRTLLTVNQWIVAAQDSRVLTGKYLDETRSWVRVNSGIDPGRILAVHIDGPNMAVDLTDEDAVDGSMIMAYDLSPHDAVEGCGGRTSSVPPERQNLVEEPAERVARWTMTPYFATLDLDKEWQRQVDKYLELGFHTAMHFTEEQYVRTLPKFERQPKEYRGRFDMPMLVDPRLFWRNQCVLGGVRIPHFDYCTEPIPADERFRVPARPYAAWFGAWDQRFPERIAPPDARAQLAEDEIGGNSWEMAAVEILWPEYDLRGQYWDIIGYVVHDAKIKNIPDTDYERTLSCYHYRRSAEIHPNLHQWAFEVFRPLVRGSKIVTSPNS
ncbi:hypothetical protein [Pseudonocardia dioxanivorans]|uniref:hypothetical protein n=1 Tax=Pseudonocardia dioxanivorans TaxID=240495 RepID=UPI00104C9B67|nr:hypothetical protein [Pseudonocardia dioxanivorans]